MADDSTEPYPPLRATSWAVLGMLSFDEELSGYDMKKWADWSLRFFYWAPSYSQIYGELHKLEELGLVTSRIVDKNDVRGKRLYRITAEGERAVTAWANESPAEPAVLKHGVMLRMWLGHTADPEKLREVLGRAPRAVGAHADPCASPTPRAPPRCRGGPIPRSC